MATSTIFAERMESLLGTQQITLRELSRSTGISSTLLSRYKRGLTKPSVAHASKIADALNTSIDWLCGYCSVECIARLDSGDTRRNRLLAVYDSLTDEGQDILYRCVNVFADSAYRR